VKPALRARLGACVALAWWVAGAASPARAQDPAPAVDVTIVGTADDLERVRGLVPRLAAGGARWLRVDKLDSGDVLRGRRDGESAAVRAWVDMTVATRARLTFANRSGDRFLVRDLELPGRLDEVERAVLAEVLESSIGALVANERAGLTRAEAEAVLARRDAPPPAPAAPPAPVKPMSTLSWGMEPAQWRPSRWARGFFYGAQALDGDAALDHGPGAWLSYAAWRKYRDVHYAGRGPALFASAQFRLPVRAGAARIGVALETIAARAGVECGPLLWSRLRVRLGGGADFVHVTPESSDPTAMLASKHWTAGLVGSAALHVNVFGGRGASMSAALLADVLPTEVRYDATIDGATTRVFTPWRVRPGLTLELTFF
jgi:hypothetical protein